MNLPELARQLEAILFVATDPLDHHQLAAYCAAPSEDVGAGLDLLDASLASRGLMLIQNAGKFELATAPDTADTIARYYGAQAKQELTKPALETLAIIAYRQPIARDEIEAIRGVASEQTLRGLLQRGLIAAEGRPGNAAKPVKYSTTHEFLRHIGVRSTADLPPLALPTAPGDNDD